MKILVVCQYYYPEPFRITDICETLSKQGHDVTVLTGLPNYPEGVIPDKYKNGKLRKEIRNGVKIIRTSEIARRKGPIFRFLNYYSFAISSKRAVKNLDNDFDVVLVNQLSPVMMANAAIKYKKKYGTMLVLYCLDLWPESLAAGGIKENSFIYKYFLKVSKKIYKKADEILITSKGFDDYFKDIIGIKKTVYLPQYAEDLFENIPNKPKKDTYDFVFAGNIGDIQSVETIVLAAKELKSNNNIKFHIVGDGSETENCKKLAGGVDNITFHGRHPVEDMPKFYALADAMLLTLKDNKHISYTLPGKVQSYMAAGKPIIASANGATKNAIELSKCGSCCSAEDYKMLAKNILEFIQDKEKIIQYGNNAKEFYEKNFSKDMFFEKLLDELK